MRSGCQAAPLPNPLLPQSLDNVKSFGRNVRRLQWLDRRVGVPVCFLLTVFRHAGDWFAPRAAPIPWRSVVFLKLAEQGSTVLAYETLREAVERVGREQVFFLTFEDNRFIVDLLGLIPAENVLEVQTRSAWSMGVSALRCLRVIRRRRIEACVDLEFFSRATAGLAFLTGAPRRVGFHTYFGEGPYRGDLLTHRVVYNAHLHTSLAFASLLLALDADPATLPLLPLRPVSGRELPRFSPRTSERIEVQQLLRDGGIPPGGRLILLNANAGDLLPLRKWDGQNYVLLANRLLREFPDLFVVFTGGPEEAGDTAALVASVGSPRCINLAGRTTLRQLMVIYDHADVLVTNDSGPAHFAALTGIDVIALFGPETPALFAALGQRSHPLWAGLACSPCVNALNNRQTACRDNACMKQLSVDLVFDAACRSYRARPDRSA